MSAVLQDRKEPHPYSATYSPEDDKLRLYADDRFPTPPTLARRMVHLADVAPGQRVLEPSAGTGNLIDAILNAFTGADCGLLVAVEINVPLAEGLCQKRDRTLYTNDSNFKIHCADFLACEDLGTFDRIVMHPPFADGQDVAHVTYALTLLKPTGRLVAVMSNGITFREDRRPQALRALIEERGGTIEPLPDDTFAVSGTHVRAVLVSVNA